MKKSNKKMLNYLALLICWFYCYNVLSQTSDNVKNVAGNYDRILVYAKSYSFSQGDPHLAKLKRISHAYSFSKDTFVITLIDMNENESFVDIKDIVVVSSIRDSLAPVIPRANSNAAYFTPELVFNFYGTLYKLIDVSSDGEHISIQKIESGSDFKTEILVTDQISNELMISDIKSENWYNLLESIEALDKKYVLMYFWSPYCAACFENIPKLRKLESSGIGILNIFFMGDDEITLVEKQISRFDIPGINFRNSPELMKYFSQNGFPFSVLVDASANKMLSGEHRLGDHNKYVSFFTD